MRFARAMAGALVFWTFSVAPTLASCEAGAQLSESDISRVEWSSYCFIGGGGEDGRPQTLGFVERSPTGRYGGQFRSQPRTGFSGTYSTEDRALVDAIAHYVASSKIESVRFAPRAIIDGCTSYVAVTRCNVTTTISEYEMDSRSAGYKRFDELLAGLDRLAATLPWKKESAEFFLLPVFPRGMPTMRPSPQPHK